MAHRERSFIPAAAVNGEGERFPADGRRLMALAVAIAHGRHHRVANDGRTAEWRVHRRGMRITLRSSSDAESCCMRLEVALRWRGRDVFRASCAHALLGRTARERYRVRLHLYERGDWERALLEGGGERCSS